MLKLIKKLTSKPKPKAATANLSRLTATELLEPHHALLERIRGLVGVPVAHWQKLYLTLFHAYAEFVQQLPASEAHHHCEAGGLLRHGLEVVYEALRLRRGVLLPVGADAEDLTRLQDVWTYACVTGALLHDLAKPVTDQQVELFNNKNDSLGNWNAISGSMPATATSYLPRFKSGRRYHHHERLAPLLAHLIIPASGLAWMAQEADLMDVWVCAIQADWDNAGVLGELISKADGTSAAQDLAGGGRIQLPTARAKPLSSRLLQTLKFLLDENQIPLNRRGAAGFITADALWLVSKRVLDQLRDQMAKDGQTGIPTRNDRLMDELQQHGIILPCGDRAIWTCQVTEADWNAELTLLRLDPAKIWGDPSRRPEVYSGQVVPQNAPENTASNPEQSNPESAAIPAPTVSIDKPAPTTASSAPNPQAATPKLDQLDDLPLPFDLPAGTKPTEQQEPAALSAPATKAEEQATVIEESDEAEEASEVEPASTHPNPFAAWLQTALRTGREEVNTAKARIHVIPEGLFLVSPGIFKDFSQEEWLQAQKHFMRLKLNQKKTDGTNVWSVFVSKAEGGRRTSTLKGILIPDAATKLDLTLPPNNPNLKLIT